MDLENVRSKLRVLRDSIGKQTKSNYIRVMSIQDVRLAESRQHTQHLCQATNMNGNRCKSKAVCGSYCKRHKI